MPKHVSDYYYIFDGRSGRSLIVDRSSGALAHEAPASVQPATLPVVEHLLHTQGPQVVRAFACWCAQQTWHPEAPPNACRALWTTACAVAMGTSSTSASLRKVRARSNEDAVLAAAVGMPRRRAGAAQLLAARSCTEPDALASAHDAMHMSVRWAEFAHDTPDPAIRAMHERHLNGLLDALNRAAPFQKPGFFQA